MKILIVNAGSSSLKYQLIDMDNEATLAKGLVERIGMGVDGHANMKVDDKTVCDVVEPIPDHVKACHLMLGFLLRRPSRQGMRPDFGCRIG